MEGMWKLEQLYTVLPEEVKQLILRFNPRLVEGIVDRWTWQGCVSGTYNMKSAYQWLMQDQAHEQCERKWNWVWKLQIPASIQFFIWQVCHHAVPTRAVLVARGIPVDATCPRCGSEQETIVHCLFTCCHITDVWRQCMHGTVLVVENDDELNVWLEQKVKTHGIIILVIMWKVWCSRNKLVFEGENAAVGAMVAHVRNLLKDVVQAYSVSSEVVNAKLPREVSWIKPTEGYVSLNVDGSAVTNPGSAGFGGLIRDHDGMFLHGFYGSVGYSNILHAELMALLHGVDLCWRMGFRKVICYSDSLQVIKLVEDGDSNFHRFGNEVAVVRSMLLKDWDFQIHHTLREGNNCADFLAKMGARCNSSMEIIDSAPPGMDYFLLADALGISFVRPN